MPQAPYGSWKSPITSDVITRSSRALTDLQLDSAGKKGEPEIIYWLEVRYSEGGKGVVCSWSSTFPEKVVEWTPENFSVRSTVHEYGGGAFLVNEGTVYFSNAKDQALYRQESPESEPQRVTTDKRKLRFADGVFAHKSIYCVMEDHDVLAEGATEVKNSLVRIDAKSGAITPIAEGASFYASPELNNAGNSLLWMQWNHSNMPWDATELWKAELNSEGDVKKASKIFGDGSTNYQQARFSPDNRVFCISDSTNWWNVYETDADSGSLKQNIYPCDQDIGSPHWVFGMTTNYTVGTIAGALKVVFQTKKQICVHDMGSNKTEKFETGFTTHSYIRLGSDEAIYCLAASPTEVVSVIKFSIADNKIVRIRASRDDTVDSGYISIPKEIQYPTGEKQDEISYGYLYEPQNKDYSAPSGTLPPLVVMAHGGPTASARKSLQYGIQYYTSKGFAVLDVNYRGSVGYGKKYRDSLKTRMGIADVEDCCYGAKYLVNEKIVDGNKLCITGESAGGYIVLRAIAWPGLFKAAVSKYGIGDLEALQMDSHKFESKYNDSLIASWPEKVEIYRERSPIHHKDEIFCPVAFFQGSDDKVVPPNQTRAMFEAVKEKGLPTAVVEFEGEAHGFRKSENIRLALDGEYFFFCKLLGIKPVITVENEKMQIVNFG